MHVTSNSTKAGKAKLLCPISRGRWKGHISPPRREPRWDSLPTPRSARPQRGRDRPPARAARTSRNPRKPRGLCVPPSRDTATCHPPDPAEPSRKHSPAGRKSARSSGLASLCPAHAPPLASGASALALSTLIFLISSQAPPDSLRGWGGRGKKKKNLLARTWRRVVRSRGFFFFQAPDVPQMPPTWVLAPPGADSSRRRGRRGPAAREARVPRP